MKAEKIYFTVLNRLTTLGILNPYKFVLETLIKMTPIMGVVKKKRGVKEFIYPKYLEPKLGEKYAIHWLLKKLKNQKGEALINSIVEEFLKASKNQGDVIKEKWELYKEVRYALSLNKRKRKHLTGKRRIDGRNKGLIAIRARGGALKRKYRYIEHYKQKWIDKWLFVMRIEYDPNRSAHIALCSILRDGIYFYVISVAKLEVGSLIITSNIKQGILQIGYTTKIKNIPEGVLINNLELMENSGSKLSRAAGTSSLIIKQYNKKYSLVKLSSKECRLISNECYATIGTVSNIERKIKKRKKASESRKRGIRPIVRGLAMNPVDHPHGGRTKGGMHWKSFSGKLAYNDIENREEWIKKRKMVRSRWKGIYIAKELQNYNVVASPTIVTTERSSVIVPYYLTKTIYVYNGRKYIGVKITEKMNPNIYRLGYMTPWVSSGFKRNKKERSNIANEDFLIYNFTRNFFYKRVYKKVVGKIKKIQLKVKNRRRARKSKKKRKFGQTSLLNHWIIKYSHLTITRFNKTFQLNLFFFDRELQKRYRIRYKRHRKKKKGSLQQQKMLRLKKLLAYKLRVKKGYNNIYLATPIQLQTKPITKVVPTIQGLSKELSKDVSKLIKQKQSRTDKINYSLARDIRRKGQKQERIYIYKDNTFENNKVKDRLQVLPNELENVTYKQLYSKKIFKKIHKITYKKNIKYVASFKFPKRYHYVDSFHFKNQARYANNYLFVKGTQPKQYYDQKKKYIEVMRKTNTLGINIKQKTANI
ncbi:hypothetical protein ACTA71_012608, partial [Dictyostelium dimigraforme]